MLLFCAPYAESLLIIGEVLELLENETGMHSCLERKSKIAGCRRQQEERQLRARREELNRAHAQRTAPAVAPKPALRGLRVDR